MTSPKHAAPRQTTISRTIRLEGRGVHSDAPVRLTLSPAEAGTGVLFQRGEDGQPIRALWRNVCATQLRTEVAQGYAKISTIEHLMAALYGLGVDNALIDLDGPEAPAMDGSAKDFVDAVLDAGVKSLAEPRPILKIVEAVRVCDGAAWAELTPTRRPLLRLDVEIAFPHPVGRQRLALDVTPGVFAREIAPARSFGFLRDAERLWRQGLALGAGLDNCLVLDDRRLLNPQGLRFTDEFARHKMLDVIGDLALAGAEIHGAFRSYRGGHRLNHALLEKLMATPAAFRLANGRAGAPTAPQRGLNSGAAP
jgi:UDP-3-O-[3-hydroxymyristoyl] N-acetylglucosamine deacetylase